MTKIKDIPMIIAQNGLLDGMEWSLESDLTIGRGSDCDIVIDDRQVSRYHAKLFFQEQGEMHITDLNSKNGTYVNSELISSAKLLNDGDVIKIALVQEFLFVSSDATLPLNVGFSKQMNRLYNLFIDEAARRIWIGENEISPPLSVSQYRLLWVLYKNSGKVVPRDQIIQGVWGEEQSVGVSEQALDALVRRTRDRLRKHEKNHEFIVTVRGYGFLFENIQGD